MHRHKVLFEEQTSRGNGDGTAQPHVDYAAGYYRPPPPNSRFLCVVMGDLNDDRKLDLAVANDEDRTVSVLLGNGDGTFQEAVNYLAGTNPQALAVGDFNRDGRLDLARADLFHATPGRSERRTIHNNGHNKGSSTLKISGITITGAIPQDFSQSNNCGTALAAAASCTINVVFGPVQIGTRAANLEIADNAAGSPQLASLNGTSTEVKLDPTSLSFVCSRVSGHCLCTQQKTTTLANVGSTTLDIGSIGVSGPFHQISNTCGTTVGAGPSGAVTVGWSRVKGGAISGN